MAKAAAGGTSYGAPTQREVLLAELIAEAAPGVEQVRLTSSGTEATMTAVRRWHGDSLTWSRIVKFAGCYHGHARRTVGRRRQQRRRHAWVVGLSRRAAERSG